MMPGSILLAAAIALVVACAAPFVLIPILRRQGVVDRPNARSLHTAVAVRGAGLATLSGMVTGAVPLLVALGSTHASKIVLVSGAVILVSIVGAIEDWRGIRIIGRAALQFGIGVLFAVGVVLTLGASWYLVPLFGFAFAAYVNISNFMDGVNGVSAFHGLIVGSLYAYLAWQNDFLWIAGLAIVMAVSFAAFLPWNLGRGRVFLGDAGSYLLGGAVASLAIVLFISGTPLVAVIAPLSVYLVDTGVTLLKRILKGEKWYESHRQHVFQRLTDFGATHIVSAMVVSGFTLAVGLLGLWAASTSNDLVRAISILVVVTLLIIYITLPKLIAGLSERQDIEKVHG